jgi:uncharacterized protein (TIGR02001 family)
MAARTSLLRAAFVLFALIRADAAAAQVGVGLGVESDHRFRGISLSDGKPDVHLDLAWDGAHGVYAGAAASSVELERGRRRAELIGYLGYAQAAGKAAAGWEIGASAAHFVDASRYDYAELYAGLIGDGWNARLSLSPDYFGQGRRTLYAELNAGRALPGPWRVFAHLGVLDAFGGGAAAQTSRARHDLRLGLGAAHGAWDVQLAFVAGDGEGLYPTPYPGRRRTLVLAASHFF